MPNLQLDGSALDHLWVRAVELFPNDLPAAQRCFAVEQVKAETDGDSDDEKHVVDARTLRLLLDAPSYASLKESVVENTKKGIVAGDILGALYLMKHFSIPEPSMNKAVFVAMEYAKKAKYGDGTRLAISEPTIRKYWEEYRPVAHLWAAFRLDQAYPYAPDRSQCPRKWFATFLGVAQELFKFGTSYIPLRARPREPILDSENCWVLPKRILAIPLNSKRQPDALLNFLKKYKAPKKTDI